MTQIGILQDFQSGVCICVFRVQSPAKCRKTWLPEVIFLSKGFSNLQVELEERGCKPGYFLSRPQPGVVQGTGIANIEAQKSPGAQGPAVLTGALSLLDAFAICTLRLLPDDQLQRRALPSCFLDLSVHYSAFKMLLFYCHMLQSAASHEMQRYLQPKQQPSTWPSSPTSRQRPSWRRFATRALGRVGQ